MTSLGALYTEHHKEGHRLGKTMLGDTRGRLLAEYIGKGKDVLDIGCRDGILTEIYAEGNRVLGVDVDEDALTEARERLNIETKAFDLTAPWPVQEESFDVVVAGEVLEHLYFPEKVVERASSVLRADGLFIGSVPNAFSLKNRLRLFFGKKKGTPLEDPTHINHFTRGELLELLRKYFMEVEIIPLGRFAFLDTFFPGMFSFMLFFVARGIKKKS